MSSLNGFNRGGGGGGGYRSPFIPRERGGFLGGERNGYSNSQGPVSMPESILHEQLVTQNMPSGDEGRRIELLGNYFKICTSDVHVYHYIINIKKVRFSQTSDLKDIDETTQPELATMTKGLEVFIQKTTPQIVALYIDNNPRLFADVPHVHDGAQNIYATRQFDLSAAAKLQTLNIGGRPSQFIIELTKIARIDLSEVERYYNKQATCISQQVMPVFDLIFRCIIQKYYVTHQRSFYNLKARQRSPKIRCVFDFVPGFMSSVRMTEFGLALNLHLRSACVLSSVYTSLDNLVADIVNRPHLDSLDVSQIKTASKIVKTTHSTFERVFTVECLSRKNPYQQEFAREDGSGMITVAAHFKERYNRNLAAFPLVKTTCPAKRDSPGKEKIYLPMEMCTLVEDQFIADYKISSLVQTELLNRSKHEPNVYFSKVCQIVQHIGEIAPQLLTHFGIQLTAKPVRFTGRVLPLPRILDGNHTFHTVAEAPARWGVFCFDDTVTREHLSNFVAQLMGEAEKMNLNLDNPKPLSIVKIEEAINISNSFENLKNLVDVEFICVVIPNRHDTMDQNDIYKLVKNYCDLEHEFACQCVRGENVKNIPRGYFDNLLLKINGKLGGMNTVCDSSYIEHLPFKMSDTMCMGVDICHRASTDRVLSSVAAAVGSYDDTMSHYSASMRVYGKSDEMVRPIGEMMSELLEQYKVHNDGRCPKNVIIFRDGVSDGQFEMVLKMELPKIRQAIEEVQADTKIALIVVQKRHITRFALTEPVPNGRKETYNVPSGTVVDTVITEPTVEGLLLNSHFSQLGTSKPTKYIVLKDDFGLTTNQIERLCFFACHNCIRTRQTISIPTCVRYADLCAYRSKLHIEAKLFLDNYSDDASSISDDTDPRLIQEREREIISRLNGFIEVQDMTRATLYYC